MFNVVNHDYHYHSSITIKPLKTIPSLSPLFLNSTSKNGDAESATIRRIQATIPIPSMPHMTPVESDLSNLPRSWVHSCAQDCQKKSSHICFQLELLHGRESLHRPLPLRGLFTVSDHRSTGNHRCAHQPGMNGAPGGLGSSKTNKQT